MRVDTVLLETTNYYNLRAFLVALLALEMAETRSEIKAPFF